MLKFFNHSSFPHKGHLTRSAHPPMNIHNIQRMNVGVINYMTMDELKILSIPSEMLKFFNHSIFPHKGHPTRSLHPPWTYTTCTSQCISNIINIPFQYHSQHKHHLISMTLSTTKTTSFHIHIIINNNINSCWHDLHWQRHLKSISS